MIKSKGKLLSSVITICILTVVMLVVLGLREQAERPDVSHIPPINDSGFSTPNAAVVPNKAVAAALFANDIHSQRVAEKLLAKGVSPDVLQKISELEVVLNEEVLECYDHDVELKRFICDWNMETTGHEYYHYDIDALESLAHGDGVAAYVYADRMMDTDLATAALYFLRSTLLTDKLGPLLRSRSIVFTTYYVKHRDDYQAGVDTQDAGLVAALALDNIAMDMGIPNDLYSLIDISEATVPDSFTETVLQKQQFFGEMLNSIKSEIGIAE